MERVTKRVRYQATNGQIFVVHTIQEYIPAGTKDNPGAVIPGLRRLELSNGEKLNYVDDDTLRFVHRGQMELRRID